MRADVSLHEIAPRLARARDQLRADHAAKLEREGHERAKRRRARDREHHLIWLVDHRDLALARALSTRSGKYIAKREAKLRAAKRELEDHRRRVA